MSYQTTIRAGDPCSPESDRFLVSDVEKDAVHFFLVGTSLDAGLLSEAMEFEVERLTGLGREERDLRCRICGSNSIDSRGTVDFYFDYNWPIYDCEDCGCRFTSHDGSTYDLLYSERSSCYSRYSVQAEVCKILFDRGDRAGLRAELSKGSKYRFIIEQIDCEPSDARILEIGSSQGHLTSYFILTGRRITGVDVSPRAVAAASAAFGNHFVRAGDPSIVARAPYDVIFHVGTIGCVADPIGMTRHCLELLKSGGRLLFNAPNRDGCLLAGSIVVRIRAAAGSCYLVSTRILARSIWGRRSGPRRNRVLSAGAESSYRAAEAGGSKVAEAGADALEGERALVRTLSQLRGYIVGAISSGSCARLRGSPGCSVSLRRYPSEFGLFVKMVKK